MLCPTVDPDELAENLFPEAKEDEDAAPPLPATDLLHLVDPDRSIDLGAGTLSIMRLLQGGATRSLPAMPHHRAALTGPLVHCKEH
jgi:spartin